MQLIAFSLAVIICTVLVIWLEKKKENYYSILAVGPMLLIVILIIGVNSDAQFELESQNCYYYEALNGTWLNKCDTTNLIYSLDPEVLQIINIAMLISILIFAFMSLEKSGIINFQKKKD